MKWRLFAYDLRYRKQNRAAADSALYLLRDFNTPAGVERIAKVTGEPEGVVAAAFANIMWQEDKKEPRYNTYEARGSK